MPVRVRPSALFARLKAGFFGPSFLIWIFVFSPALASVSGASLHVPATAPGSEHSLGILAGPAQASKLPAALHLPGGLFSENHLPNGSFLFVFLPHIQSTQRKIVISSRKILTMLSTKQNDLLLVPYDFTKEADTALAHASGIAKTGSDSVRLLHVINRETRARLKKEGISEEDLKQKLASIASNNTEKTGVQTAWHVVEGSIFSAIAEDAKDANADLIVLGTHGVSGMQHVLGADVMRILENCHVPGIVVQQKKIDEEGYNHIVLPIDENRFGKNKIAYAVAIARYFNAQVHVYSDFSSDEFIAKAIKNNTAQALETLREHGIPCEHIAQENDDETFDQALVRYAVAIDAELIVISSRPDERNVAALLFDRVEEEVINNKAMIPVLVVNPQQDVSHLSIDISTW